MFVRARGLGTRSPRRFQDPRGPVTSQRTVSTVVRILAIVAFTGILAFDLTRMFVALLPRYVFGRVTIGALLDPGQRPCYGLLSAAAATVVGREAWIASAPVHLAIVTAIATILGIAIDRSQIGRYPIVATFPAEGLSSPIGLNYLVYLPEGYHCSSRRWPLALFLHGSGSVGSDLTKVRSTAWRSVSRRRGPSLHCGGPSEP